jgi:hypothetical protein
MRVSVVTTLLGFGQGHQRHGGALANQVGQVLVLLVGRVLVESSDGRTVPGNEAVVVNEVGIRAGRHQHTDDVLLTAGLRSTCLVQSGAAE